MHIKNIHKYLYILINYEKLNLHIILQWLKIWGYTSCCKFIDRDAFSGPNHLLIIINTHKIGHDIMFLINCCCQ